jgi:hypothetical protein
MKDKKKIILHFLKIKGQQSETNIANEMRSNLWQARKYLAELEFDKKIKKMETPNAVYWDLFREAGR